MNKENLVPMALPKRKRTSRDSLQSLPSASVVTPKEKMKIEVSTHTWDGADEEEAVEYFASHCNGLLRSSVRLRRKEESQRWQHKPLSVSTLKLERCSEKMDLEITRLIEAGNYIDIDNDNHRALVFAAPYGGSIFKGFEEQVRSGQTIQGFLDEGASPGLARTISPRWRSLLIEYLLTFSAKARLFNTTLHLAVSILDRYLECCQRTENMKDVSLERLMCIGVACLSISVKYEEPQLSTVSTLLSPLVALWKHVLHDPRPPIGSGRRGTFSRGLRPRDPASSVAKRTGGNMVVSPTAKQAKDLSQAKIDLVHTEFQVLAVLLWQVAHPTVWTFLHRYATAGHLRGNQISIAECLCDRVLLDYGLQRHRPHLLAAAIVGLMRCLVNQPHWTPTLQYTTGLHSGDVQACMKDIQEVLSLERTLRHRSATAGDVGGPSGLAHTDVRAANRESSNKARKVIPASKFYGLDKGRNKSAGTRSEPVGAKRAVAAAEVDTDIDFPFSQDSRATDGPVAYLPGNSVRSKHQDVIYRAIVELPEGGPDANPNGTTSAHASPVKPAPRVSPPSSLRGRESGVGHVADASGAMESNKDMSRHHKRDALASASSRLLFDLDLNVYHSFRHPSYSPG